MTNRTAEADAVAFAFVAPGRRAIPTCPTSMDGATHPVAGNVRKRTSVDVVWGGSGTGTVLAPTRYRPGDGGGSSFTH
jgi:hypothetical protein